MWAQIITTVIGLWVMVAPGIFGYSTSAADSGHIFGPVIISFSVISFWEATRTVRKWNYPLAVWLLLAPWILGYSGEVATYSDMISGVLIIIFTAISWKRKDNFGGGWSSLAQEEPEHIRRVKE